MSSSNTFNKIKYHYFKQHGSCCYCGIQCILIMNNQERYRIYGSILPPDNLATLEHIYPKTDIRRFIRNKFEKVTLMACRKCNSDRGAKESHLNAPPTECHPSLLIDLLNGKYNNKFVM